jgi:hypothetical protein
MLPFWPYSGATLPAPPRFRKRNQYLKHPVSAPAEPRTERGSSTCANSDGPNIRSRQPEPDGYVIPPRTAKSIRTGASRKTTPCTSQLPHGKAQYILVDHT